MTNIGKDSATPEADPEIVPANEWIPVTTKRTKWGKKAIAHTTVETDSVHSSLHLDVRRFLPC